jgi:hypothetical protein
LNYFGFTERNFIEIYLTKVLEQNITEQVYSRLHFETISSVAEGSNGSALSREVNLKSLFYGAEEKPEP